MKTLTTSGAASFSSKFTLSIPSINLLSLMTDNLRLVCFKFFSSAFLAPDPLLADMISFGFPCCPYPQPFALRSLLKLKNPQETPSNFSLVELQDAHR